MRVLVSYAFLLPHSPSRSTLLSNSVDQSISFQLNRYTCILPSACTRDASRFGEMNLSLSPFACLRPRSQSRLPNRHGSFTATSLTIDISLPHLQICPLALPSILPPIWLHRRAPCLPPLLLSYFPLPRTLLFARRRPHSLSLSSSHAVQNHVEMLPPLRFDLLLQTHNPRGSTATDRLGRRLRSVKSSVRNRLVCPACQRNGLHASAADVCFLSKSSD